MPPNSSFMDSMTISDGFAEQNRQAATTLYLEAFGPKLARVFGTGPRINAFVSSVLNPKFAISATDADGQLLGIAGFKTAQGALVGGTLSDLTRHYGTFSGTLRGLVVSLLEREVETGVLLMDGICVARGARGRGIGSRLLDAITAKARAMDLAEVRLDVIDSNPRARALYARKGFTADAQQHLGPLRHIFGFSSATTMRLALDRQPAIDAPV